MQINQKIVAFSTNILKIITSVLLTFIMCASNPLLCSSDDEREAWNAVMCGSIDGGLGFDMMEQRSIDGNYGFASGENSEAGVHSGTREVSCAPAEQLSRKRKRVEGDERRAKKVPTPSPPTAAHVLFLPDSRVDLSPLPPFSLSDQNLDLTPLSHAFAYSDSVLCQTPPRSDSVLRETPPPSNPILDSDLDPTSFAWFLCCRADDSAGELLDGPPDMYEPQQNVQCVPDAHAAPNAAGVEKPANEKVSTTSEKRKQGNIGGATDLPTVKKAHATERNFKCGIDGCTRTFTQLNHLSTHEKNIHFAVGSNGQLIAKKVRDSEKPFECNFEGCTYASTISSNLKVHIRTHTDEKPFKCVYENCTYASFKLINLKLHIRTHTDEKPFKCVYENCTYASATSSNLKSHTKRKHTR